MFTFQSNNNKQRNSIDHNILTSNNNINQMHMHANGPNAGDAMGPNTKFMSQSTIDLKKAQLMFTHEAIFQQQQQQQHHNGVNTRIAATESMGNLIDCTNRQSAPAFLLHHQQQNSGGRKSNAIMDSDMIMANHIAMNSNGLTSNGDTNGDDRINRTDSLKENIDTITQLQAKLMSTQLHDNSVADFGHDSIGDSTIPEDDCLSADDTSSVSQLSSESLTSNDINEILDAEGIDAVQPSSPTSTDNQCQTEDGDTEEALTSIGAKLNETIMSDVGSQTDESILDSFSLTTNSNGLPTKTVIVTRSRFADEFDCERLTDDLVQQLSPNDRLRHILGKFFPPTTAFRIRHPIY